MHPAVIPCRLVNLFLREEMQHHHNCNHSHPSRYRYKGYWIEIFLEADDVSDAFGSTLNDRATQTICDHRILYRASIELPNQGGVISGEPQESKEKAEFAAEELINSWN